MKALADSSSAVALPPFGDARARWRTRYCSIVLGGTILSLVVLMGLLAPFLGTTDPARIDPAYRNKLPGTQRALQGTDGRAMPYTHWMGTDSLGRDIYSRVVYGARVSLVIGLSVALLSAAIGLTIGLISGYLPWLDAIVMRIMDGLMAVPAILLAIALMSLASAGLHTVIIAIVIAEIPALYASYAPWCCRSAKSRTWKPPWPWAHRCPYS